MILIIPKIKSYPVCQNRIAFLVGPADKVCGQEWKEKFCYCVYLSHCFVNLVLGRAWLSFYLFARNVFKLHV